MEGITQFLILISTITLLLAAPVRTADPCKPDSCDAARGPIVRFPFRLTGRHAIRCGYPGFHLHCNSRNETIVNLPRSGDFIVQHIDYKRSALYIGDPGLCLPGRALNFSVEGSPYDATYLTRFAILNCSEGLTEDMRMDIYYVVLSCLSARNATVVAAGADLPAEMMPPPCRRIGNATVPPWTVSEMYWGANVPEEDFELRWSSPGCGRCETRGGRCGFKRDLGLEIGCSKSSGLPIGAKYAIIIGGGIPGVICLIGLTCFIGKRIQLNRQQRRLTNELPMSTTFDRQMVVRATRGLDRTTIESYPKTELGLSRRLPNPSDNTCSICLSDYKPKDILKSIPECNHYFHATCIDEWLKLNGTCPLCRNLLETSSTTPTSSTLLSPSSTASDHH